MHIHVTFNITKMFKYIYIFKTRASQMPQWEGIHLLMQETRKMWVQSLGQEEPWSRKWQLSPVFLPGKFHGQRSQWAAVNSMDRGAWLTAIHGVTKSQIRQSIHTYILSRCQKKKKKSKID